MIVRVGFAGMTHLGLISATATAAQGFDVVCFDRDKALIGRLQAGELPVLEPGLPELLSANGAHQSFSAEIDDLATCDVVYIAPDVPTDDKGQSDLSGIRRLISEVSAAIGPDAVLVVLCQVPPGFTRGLDRNNGTTVYQVETLVFGRAVERATEPERFIVGLADPDAGLPEPLRIVLESFDVPILPMLYESAELAKIAINMCLVASVSVANTMAEVCENIGADWSEIVPALKLDKRIGQFSYLKPGLGIAGGNLERDLATVISLADRHQTDAGVINAWISNSRHRKNWAASEIRKIADALDGKPTVAVWGLAYKENTHSIKNSPSIETLSKIGDLPVRLHDPVVDGGAVDHPAKTLCSDPLSVLDGADILAILTPWPQYRAIALREISDRLTRKIVIDPYRVLDPKAAQAVGLTVHTLGVAPIQAEG